MDFHEISNSLHASLKFVQYFYSGGLLRWLVHSIQDEEHGAAEWFCLLPVCNHTCWPGIRSSRLFAFTPQSASGPSSVWINDTDEWVDFRLVPLTSLHFIWPCTESDRKSCLWHFLPWWEDSSWSAMALCLHHFKRAAAYLTKTRGPSAAAVVVTDQSLLTHPHWWSVPGLWKLSAAPFIQFTPLKAFCSVSPFPEEVNLNCEPQLLWVRANTLCSWCREKFNILDLLFSLWRIK